MKTPIQQLDKLARYLINNYGDMVRVDDMPNEDAVNEAIRILEQQRHLTTRSSRAAGTCPRCGKTLVMGVCEIGCGHIPPPA